MDAPLNFLFIEDNRSDFHFMERHLRKNGLSVRCHRVDNPDELERALLSSPWDAVLSDYHTPGMTFENNLALIRSSLADIPVILVSGNLGEEKAVSLLKLGVTDFILKDNLARLVPSLQRALQETAEHRAKQAAEQALRLAEAELRAHRDRLEELVMERTAALAEANRLLEEDIKERKRVERALSAEKQRAQATLHSIADAVITTDMEGHIKSVNPAACRLFERLEHELLGMNLKALYRGTDSGRNASIRQGAFGETFYEVSFVRSGSETFDAWVASKTFDDEMGRPMMSLVIHDITSRRHAENELRLSRQRAVDAMQTAETERRRLDALLEAAPVGIVMVDAQGHLIRTNRENRRIWGEHPETRNVGEYAQWKGWRSDGDGYWMDPIQPDQWVLARALRGEEAPRDLIEIEPFDAPGNRRSILASGAPVRDVDGRIVGAVAAQVDVTDRIKVEKALRESEQRFRLLHENAPVGIAHLDLKGRWIYANRKFSKITGYTLQELAGLNYLDVTPEEERASAIELTEKLFAGKAEVDREMRMLRKDGSICWIRLTATLLRDESGKPQYSIGIFEDINERKQAEAALQESEERFRATFENAPLGIAEATLEGRFINANPKLLEILGYAAQEFRHLSLADITHPADMELALSQFQKLVSGQIPSYVLEKRYLRKDGSFVWMNVTTTLRYIGGVPKYVIGVLEDVTARRRAEEDLRRALEHSYHIATHDALT